MLLLKEEEKKRETGMEGEEGWEEGKKGGRKEGGRKEEKGGRKQREGGREEGGKEKGRRKKREEGREGGRNDGQKKKKQKTKTKEGTEKLVTENHDLTLQPQSAIFTQLCLLLRTPVGAICFSLTGSLIHLQETVFVTNFMTWLL